MNISKESPSASPDFDQVDVVDDDPNVEFDDGELSGDTEKLIRRIGEVINAARPMPLSSSAMINRDEVLHLVDQALHHLPDELRSARWLMKERNDYLAKSHRDGEDIIDAARARAEQMVQRTEVVKAAELRARQIVDRAEADSRRMRNETEDYCDQKLGSFEIALEKTLRTVAAGRTKLQSTSRSNGAANGETIPTVAVAEHENGVDAVRESERQESSGESRPTPGQPSTDAGFFDQDTSS